MKKRTCGTVGGKKRILIVDDHPVVRAGLRSYLEQQADLCVCGEVGSAQEALAAVERLRPHLAVIDLSLQDSHGLELIKNLHVLHPELLMLAFSIYEEHLYADRVLHAGGHGYLEKQHGPERVLEAVRRLLAGELYFSPPIIKHLLQSHRTSSAQLDPDPLACLSDRELEVFELVGQGLNAKATAHRLHIGHKTVGTYCRRIQDKLHLHDGHAVYRYAMLSNPKGKAVLAVSPTG